MRILNWQPLQLPSSSEEILDACPYTASTCLLLTVHNIYLVSHAHPIPQICTTIHISELSFPDDVLFAAFRDAFKSAGVALCDVVASAASSVNAFLVTVGDGQVIMKQPQVISRDVVNIRLSDTSKLRQEASSLYLVNSGESLLMSNMEGSVCNRRVASRGDWVFVAMNERLLRFTGHRLEFAVEFESPVSCVAILYLDYVAVVLTTGQVVVVSGYSGCVVLKSHFSPNKQERIKSCVGCCNGLLVASNQRIALLQISKSTDAGRSFFLPYSNRLPLAGRSIAVPKEYDALPLRHCCLYSDEIVAVAGRYGIAITRVNVPKSQWILLHPYNIDSLVFADCLVFISQARLLAAVTCIVNGVKRYELRIYDIKLQPVEIVSKLTLDRPTKHMCFDSGSDTVSVVDSGGQLQQYRCDDWTLVSSAELASHSDIRCFMFHENRFFIHLGNQIYSVKSRAIKDNPVNCTLASVWEGGRVERMFRLDHGFFAVLLHKGSHWSLVFKLDDLVINSVEIEPPVIECSLEYATMNDGTKKSVLSHIVVGLLSHQMFESASQLAKYIPEHLEHIIFLSWKSKLIPDFLRVYPDRSSIKLAVARVSRTLEYKQAVELLGLFDLTLPELYREFIQDANADGLLLVFKLCVEEDHEDFVSPLVELLLEQGRLDDARQIYLLSRSLNLDLAKSDKLLSDARVKAYSRLNLVDLKILHSIISEAAYDDIDICVPDQRMAIQASLIIDPEIVGWTETVPELRKLTDLIHEISI